VRIARVAALRGQAVVVEGQPAADVGQRILFCRHRHPVGQGRHLPDDPSDRDIVIARLYPAAARTAARSAEVVSRIGSTEWMRNGSMIVRNGSSDIHGPPRNRTWAGKPPRLR
jgi:hypothetical protein